MSCNIRIPLQQIIVDVTEALADGFIRRDNAVLNEAVLNEVTLRGDISVDTSARNALCRILQDCNITATELEWLVRPTTVGDVAISISTQAGVEVAWRNLKDLVEAFEWIDKPTAIGDVAISVSTEMGFGVEWQNLESIMTVFDAGRTVPASRVTTNKFGVVRTLDQVTLETVTPYDFGAIGDGLEHKLSERFDTLELAQAQYPTAKSLDDTIDLVALESFFAYCQTKQVSANASIKSYINRTLEIFGTSASTYTGALDLVNRDVTTEIDWLLQINCWGFTFNGRISASGNHNVAAKDRKQLGGILIGERTGGSPGTAITITVDYISVQGFRDFGVHNVDSSMFLNCNNISASYIGSMGWPAFQNGAHNHLTTITERVSDYKNSFNDQSSVLRVAELPPGNDPYYVFIVHGGEIYQLRDIDRVNSTITVYPYLKPSELSTDIAYIYGNAACIYGDDTNAGRVNRVYSIVCGIAYNPSASYGFVTEISTSESCGIGILHGKAYSHIVSANTIEYAYFEDTTFHIVFASAVTNPSSLQILSTHGFEIARIADVTNWRVSIWDDFRVTGNLPIYAVNVNGVTHSNKSTQFSDYNLTGSGEKFRFVQLSGATLPLLVNWDVFKNFGYRTFTLVVSPTDVDVTITTSMVGVTLMNERNTGFVIRANKRHQVITVTPVISHTGKYLYIGLESSPPSVGGATIDRPTGAAVITGHQYFDTTLNKQIVWSGAAWVDVMGVAV